MNYNIYIDELNDEKIIIPKKNYYCSNCNKKGHNHRMCHFPTNSYGCIIYKRSSDNQIRYLMIQRKYTPEYIELIRGKYFNFNATTNTGELNYKYLLLSLPFRHK